MVLGRRRTVVAFGTVAAMLTGGSAWAASAGLSVKPHPAGVHSSDVTDPNSSSTDATGSTVEPSSTSSSTDTTDTSDTSVPDTVTTTSTVGDTTTTMPETPTTAASCKPGWGFGDTNHCHSGPPGLKKHPARGHHGKPSSR